MQACAGSETRVVRMDNHERYMVPGLTRGLEILKLLSTEGGVLALTEIAKHLKISRSSAYRLLYTLEHLGYVERVEDSKRYRLGPRVLDLGFGYLSSLDVVSTARLPLERLRDELNMSAHLVIRDGLDVVYLLRCAANNYMTSNVHVGTRFPAHATSHGQVLLADLSDDEIAGMYRNVRMKAFTSDTPTSVSKLLDRVREARAKGCLVAWGLFDRGLASVAAPVRDATGRAIAAINVTCPITQFESKAIFEKRAVSKVVATAAAISRDLGFRSSTRSQSA